MHEPYTITAHIETTFDQNDIIREMIETGEYGFGLNDITTEAIIDFVGRLEFGSDVMYNNTPHNSVAKRITYRINDNTLSGDYYYRTFDGVAEKVRDAMNSNNPEAIKELLGEV